jgi:hypothetical protein
VLQQSNCKQYKSYGICSPGVDSSDVADSSDQEAEPNFLLSQEAVAIGGTTKSLKFLASTQVNEVLALVDSSSSHSFINVKLLTLLSGVSVGVFCTGKL